MSKYNYLVYDLETTGLKASEGAEIIQLAAVAIDGVTLERHHADQYEVLIKPEYPDKASKEAIKIVGQENFDKACEEGLHPKVALQGFIDWAFTLNDNGKNFWTKPVRVGHNIRRFDNPFLDYWLEHYKILKKNKYGDLDGPWNFKDMDTMNIFHVLFESDPQVEKFNLDACASMLKIERSSNIHDAMEDVEITTQLFVRALKFIRTARKEIKVK